MVKPFLSLYSNLAFIARTHVFCKNLTLHNSVVIASQISPRGVVLPRTQQGKQLQGELIYVCYFFTMLICMLNKLKPCCIGKKNLLYSAPVAALANLPPSIIENFFAQLLLFWRVSPDHIICILHLMALKNVHVFLKTEIMRRKKPFKTVKVEKTFFNNW